MTQIERSLLLTEAENCRGTALAYLGRPEGPFLLSAAKAFEELAENEALPNRGDCLNREKQSG